MILSKSVTIAVGTSNLSPGNRALAADSTVNRFLRGVYATNTTNAAISVNVGGGAAATLAAANADIAFGFQVPANAASYPVAVYNGKGARYVGSGSANEFMAFASGSGLNLKFVYDEDTLG